MFRVADKNELSQISLTGARGIILLGLLMMQPQSLKEIRETFIRLNILDKSSSDDILRIDLNTLKYIGCDISRASKATNYKYVLKSHPFSIKVTEEELGVLKRVYRYFKENTNIYNLVLIDELFNKISNYIGNGELKEQLLGISILKDYDKQMVKDLLLDCEQKRTLELVYFNKVYSNETKKEVIAQKITLQNDKLYLYAYDLLKKDALMLPVSRIVKIILRKLQKNEIEPQTTNIKIKLINIDRDDLNENERVVEILEDGYIVEGSYHNDFIAMQRVLSFGSKCTVLEPMDFREKIIVKLKQMRDVYGK